MAWTFSLAIDQLIFAFSKTVVRVGQPILTTNGVVMLGANTVVGFIFVVINVVVAVVVVVVVVVVVAVVVVVVVVVVVDQST